jgi:uncharacterized membrane protein
LAVLIFRLAHRVRSSLWLVPALCVLAGVILSLGTIALDRALGPRLIPLELTGDPDAALFILSTIATSMVTLAALVLTITMVVVQLAMGQFSPRIVRSILQDTPSQIAIGVFVGTFAHAMLTLREVRVDGPEGPVVPGIAVLTAFLLVIVSIILLVFYVHHLGQSLRVAALIELVGNEMRDLVEVLYPDGGPEAPQEPGVLIAPESGVIFHIAHDRLVAAAADADCVIEVVAPLGDFVPAGAALLRVDPPGAPLRDDVLTFVGLGPERTMNQDLAYGIRMLVDIAERGLSEPFLDPTTAVQAIDRLHDCLRQLVARPFPDGRHHDEEGRVRLIVPTLDWAGYVDLAFDEIRRAGRLSPQVPRRLAAALDDLIDIAPADRRPPLERQRRLLDRDAGGDAPVPDRQGIGSGADVMVPVDALSSAPEGAVVSPPVLRS